jgi:hypothetical protein
MISLLFFAFPEAALAFFDDSDLEDGRCKRSVSGQWLSSINQAIFGSYLAFLGFTRLFWSFISIAAVVLVPFKFSLTGLGMEHQDVNQRTAFLEAFFSLVFLEDFFFFLGVSSSSSSSPVETSASASAKSSALSSSSSSSWVIYYS